MCRKQLLLVIHLFLKTWFFFIGTILIKSSQVFSISGTFHFFLSYFLSLFSYSQSISKRCILKNRTYRCWCWHLDSSEDWHLFVWILAFCHESLACPFHQPVGSYGFLQAPVNKDYFYLSCSVCFL